MTSFRTSVIIPTLNEASNLAACVKALGKSRDFELIVVDGGSLDGTPKIAQTLKATVITAPACRALQMNLGARIATNDIFMFLHADTIVPENWADVVHDTLNLPGVALGAFKFGLDESGSGYRLIEKLANFRSQFFQMPYGDQAMFVKRDIFQRVGGFPEITIMEDYAFCRDIRKLGVIITANCTALTSGRRWHKQGLLRTTLVNQLIIALFNLGVSDRVLRRIYDSTGKD